MQTTRTLLTHICLDSSTPPPPPLSGKRLHGMTGAAPVAQRAEAIVHFCLPINR